MTLWPRLSTSGVCRKCYSHVKIDWLAGEGIWAVSGPRLKFSTSEPMTVIEPEAAYTVSSDGSRVRVWRWGSEVSRFIDIGPLVEGIIAIVGSETAVPPSIEVRGVPAALSLVKGDLVVTLGRRPLLPETLYEPGKGRVERIHIMRWDRKAENTIVTILSSNAPHSELTIASVDPLPPLELSIEPLLTLASRRRYNSVTIIWLARFSDADVFEEQVKLLEDIIAALLIAV